MMSEEAIPERDLDYEPPEGSSVEEATWSPDDQETWELMATIRPLLRCFR